EGRRGRGGKRVNSGGPGILKKKPTADSLRYDSTTVLTLARIGIFPIISTVPAGLELVCASVRVLRVDSTPCFLFVSSRRRHTRSLRDWSSDVCSSDLTMRYSSAFTYWCENLSIVSPLNRSVLN